MHQKTGYGWNRVYKIQRTPLCLREITVPPRYLENGAAKGEKIVRLALNSDDVVRPIRKPTMDVLRER